VRTLCVQTVVTLGFERGTAPQRLSVLSSAQAAAGGPLLDQQAQGHRVQTEYNPRRHVGLIQIIVISGFAVASRRYLLDGSAYNQCCYARSIEYSIVLTGTVSDCRQRSSDERRLVIACSSVYHRPYRAGWRERGVM
jgi:hypothetical protein